MPRPRGCGCCCACPCDGSLVSQPVSFLPRSGRRCRLSWLLWGSRGTAITPRDSRSGRHHWELWT
uniref:Uncharacterized protein n=1 Tax=Pan paniscus TaxID=9597 RepID=A0A2R9CGB1_PANPA